MTQTSYPFDAQSVSEAQFSQYFREFVDTGVAASSDSLALKVSASGANMNVTVQAGFAIVRGFAYNSDASVTLTIPAANTQSRVDRVVLRLDPSSNSIVLATKTGTPGSATPPTLTQTDSAVYELSLAKVTVGASVSVISSGSVVDERSFSGMCVVTWTTSTRPSSPRVGKLGYNTVTGAWEFWDGSAWASLLQSLDWSSIEGAPTSFTPSSHTHPWADITGKPTQFTPVGHGHAWADIQGTSPYATTGHTHDYAPSNHSHNFVQGGVWAGTSLNAGEATVLTRYMGLSATPRSVVVCGMSDDGVHSIVMSLNTYDAANAVILCRNMGTGAETFDISWVAVM